jgi:hypothetical protein
LIFARAILQPDCRHRSQQSSVCSGSPRIVFLFGVAICIAFGTGAAFRVIITEMLPRYSLIVPVTLLLCVALLCRQDMKIASDPAAEGR